MSIAPYVQEYSVLYSGEIFRGIRNRITPLSNEPINMAIHYRTEGSYLVWSVIGWFVQKPFFQ